ncbi:ABC transporter ATP-binding protein [Aquimarina pacifica]|uniref:ABC transporter ATP-binding protein n=1 Tax=Aquimarina pacifica TaxID=1296415 RepID=UPI0004712F92|nr:ABC transporter ATP-binding protein [Aquimarina pacifica]
MIIADNIFMQYPMPKKYIEYITSPFRSHKFTALKGVSLNIEAGDRIAFLGTNGAGKTTLLKIIGGLLYPTTGSLTVNGHDTKKESLKAKKKVGFVLNEERSFYWRLTGRQNLLFFASLDNFSGDGLHKKVDDLMDLVGLQEAKDKIFAGYSSGMKQKLAIARGMISSPDILILDEPTRTLDPISADDIASIISKRVHVNKDRTLLIATHSLAEAQRLCDKVCFMKKGAIVDFSSISDIIDKYKTLENYYKLIINSDKNFES